MSQQWRGEPEYESAMGKFLRNRWPEGLVWVLNIDYVICNPERTRGILIEAKHRDANDKKWTLTREMARDRGWWAALFVYDTDDGGLTGNVTRIDAVFIRADGEQRELEDLDFDDFDRWISALIGTRLAA